MQSVAFRDAQDIYVSNSGEFVVIATRQDGIMMHNITGDTHTQIPNKRLSQDGTTVAKPSKVIMDDLEQVLCVGYHSGLIDIYSVFTGQPIKLVTTLSSHTKTINTLHALENDMLLSSSDDNEAKLWNYGPALQEQMNNLSDNMLDQVMMETSEAKPETPLEGSTATSTSQLNTSQVKDTISCLIVMSDEKIIISGSYNGPIRMWHMDTPS
jgi:WD40 repeat protein